MKSAVETPTDFLAMMQLDTLLGDKNCHVLNIKWPVPPDASIEEKRYLEEAPDKVVFSKGQTIAYVRKNTLYVRADFFQGGKFNNVYVQDELQMICHTYQLDGMQSIAEKQHLIDQLQYLNQELTNITDSSKADAILQAAKEINDEVQSNDTAKIVHGMALRVEIIRKGDHNTDLKNFQALEDLKAALHKATTMTEVQEIMDLANKTYLAIPASSEAQTAYDFFTKVQKAMKENNINSLLPMVQKAEPKVQAPFNTGLPANPDLKAIETLGKADQKKIKIISDMIEKMRASKKASEIIAMLKDARELTAELPSTPVTKLFPKEFAEIEAKLNKKK